MAEPLNNDNPTPAPAPAAPEAPLMGGDPAPAPAAPEAAPTPEDAAKPLMAEGTIPQPEDAPPQDPDGAETAEVDYGKTLKLPDGFEMNAPVMEKATALFAKAKLPPEVAQELIDLYCGEFSGAAEAEQRRNVETVTAWRDAIVKRPEYQQELPLVQLAIADMAQEHPEIRALYNDPVFGNMPELWQIALCFGKRFQTEGTMLSGGRDGAPAGSSLPDMLYPTMKQ